MESAALQIHRRAKSRGVAGLGLPGLNWLLNPRLAVWRAPRNIPRRGQPASFPGESQAQRLKW